MAEMSTLAFYGGSIFLFFVRFFSKKKTHTEFIIQENDLAKTHFEFDQTIYTISFHYIFFFYSKYGHFLRPHSNHNAPFELKRATFKISNIMWFAIWKAIFRFRKCESHKFRSFSILYVLCHSLPFYHLCHDMPRWHLDKIESFQLNTNKV